MRNFWLNLEDQALLLHCQLKTYQGSGPGGQHRNKTNSGVSLQLKNTDLEVHCCEDRSMHVNRVLALRRLRLRIALECPREIPQDIPFAFPGSQGHIQSQNPRYPLWIADVLDRINAQGGDLKNAALDWGLSSTALLKILFADKAVIEAIQALRKLHQKPLLRHP